MGNPVTGCYPECLNHDECRGHLACSGFKCIDPCIGACGIDAKCEVVNHNAICSCPKGYTGHPYNRCILCKFTGCETTLGPPPQPKLQLSLEI